MAQPYMLIPAQGSDQADEWHRLGLTAQIEGKLPDAQQKYQQALRLDPRHALATQNLAIVFAQSGHLNEALLAIERAAIFGPEHGVIRMNWALMCLEADRIEDALLHAEESVKIDPNVNSKMTLAMVVASAGMPEKAVPLYNEILDVDPKHPAAGPNSCFTQTLTNAKPAELLKQRKRWWDANHYIGNVAPHTNDRSTKRPLRIGYLGGDFKQHSAAFIFAAVLLHHTPAVEMYLYSTLSVDPNQDFKTKKFQDAAGSRWRDISATNDEDADRLIRKDKIDILVDLAAHTNGGRLPIFTRKPAPVQVTAWGFAHGTGCPEIDYFFADPIVVTAEERQHFAEKIVDLPCVVTMEPPLEYNLKGTSTPPIRKNGYITYGSYARYEKMSDDCIKTFAEILKQVPDAKIEFKDNAYRRPFAIKRIMRLMDGIAPERMLFSLATSHPDHMLAYQQADIILDPFWHCGGVVGLEQLYMGCPMVTLRGTQPAGRTGSSVLTAIGRPEWVASTIEEYIDIAVKMADDTKMLAKARTTLRDDLLKSPICAGYVEAVEKAYKEMWERWVNE